MKTVKRHPCPMRLLTTTVGAAFIGLPHSGHVAAWSLMVRLQSGQVVRGTPSSSPRMGSLVVVLEEVCEQGRSSLM
jgi:hypothetical protein